MFAFCKPENENSHQVSLPCENLASSHRFLHHAHNFPHPQICPKRTNMSEINLSLSAEEQFFLGCQILSECGHKSEQNLLQDCSARYLLGFSIKSWKIGFVPLPVIFLHVLHHKNTHEINDLEQKRSHKMWFHSPTNLRMVRKKGDLKKTRTKLAVRALFLVSQKAFYGTVVSSSIWLQNSQTKI